MGSNENMLDNMFTFRALPSAQVGDDSLRILFLIPTAATALFMTVSMGT